jgi:hypothetical protein
MNLVLRSLVLCCGLVVALPPGWCCAIESLLKPKTTRATQSCGCCPKCRNKTSEPSTPMPAAPERCPCLDRDLTAPDSPLKPDLTAAHSIATVVPVLAFDSTQCTVAMDRPVYILPVSSHIMNCLWLC